MCAVKRDQFPRCNRENYTSQSDARITCVHVFNEPRKSYTSNLVSFRIAKIEDQLDENTILNHYYIIYKNSSNNPWNIHFIFI